MAAGPISGLPAAGALVGSESFPLVQSGVTKRSTPSAVLTLANTASALGCELAHSAVQSIPSGAWTTMLFDTETRDDGNFHDPGDNSKITIPQTGKYIVGSNVRIDINSSGSRLLRILLNETTEVGLTATPALFALHTYMTLFAPPRRYAAGDYLQLQVYQNSGVAIDALESNKLFNAALIVLTA